MLLHYKRCPNDPNIPIATRIELLEDGQVVEVGIAEIASAVALGSAAHTITLAVKNGVVPDFAIRTALTLVTSLAEDPHGLCSLREIIEIAAAIQRGRKVQVDEGGLLCTEEHNEQRQDKGVSPSVDLEETK